MKNILTCSVSGLALMVCAIVTWGQDSPGAKKPRTPADYEVRTLKTLSAKGPDADSRGDMADTRIVYANILPSRVRVTYTGRTRPLPQIKTDVLRTWARLYAGSMESYTTPYQTEVLFKEKGLAYWLAVRNDSLPRLKEIRKGRAVDLLLIRLGAARASHKWEPLLLVESLEATR